MPTCGKTGTVVGFLTVPERKGRYKLIRCLRHRQPIENLAGTGTWIPTRRYKRKIEITDVKDLLGD